MLYGGLLFKFCCLLETLKFSPFFALVYFIALVQELIIYIYYTLILYIDKRQKSTIYNEEAKSLQETEA